jgi:RNA polymerase sigma-70 factor, ECF subfamily
MSANMDHATAGPPAAEATFQELLTPLLGSAYGAALHMTRNREDAEDVVQETMLRAFRSFATYQPGTHFKAWFFRILTNCCISRHRSRRDEVTMSEWEDGPQLYLYRKGRELSVLPDGPDPALSTLGRLEAEQVASALQELPDEFRVVATLYFVEDLRYRDIAAALDLPIGTVRSRLHRARRILQVKLWQVAEDNGLVRGRSRMDEVNP